MLSRSKTWKPGLWARLFLPSSWKLTLDPGLPDLLLLQGALRRLPCMDIQAVTTVQGLLWHTLEIRSAGHTDRLAGLSAAKVAELQQAVLNAVNGQLAKAIAMDIDNLSQVDATLQALTAQQSRYLANADVSQALSRLPGAVARALAHPLLDQRRIPEALRRRFPRSFELITNPDLRHRYNQQFVPLEMQRYRAFFDRLAGHSLTDEQREACIRLEDNNLLVASAGSGKTATMVGKVAYVLEKGLYRPEEILILAYNSDAARELRERLAQQLQLQEGEPGCQVATFHALGRTIIENVTGKPPQLANWAENSGGEAQVISGIIRQLSTDNARFASIWQQLLTLYPQADRPVSTFCTLEEYQRYIADRRSGGDRQVSTLAGLTVRSFQERSIVNWLWLNRITFDYERQLQVADADGQPRFIHPDFYYPQVGLWHEHYALDKDGNAPPAFVNYLKHANLKRAAFKQAGLPCIETTSAMAEDGTLLPHLEALLRALGMVPDPRSLEEREAAIRDKDIHRFHHLVSVCIRHIRSGNLTREMLMKRAESLQDKTRARLFAEAVWLITEAWTEKLNQQQHIDFDSMIGDAVTLLESGRWQSPWALILVDEFQDISEPRARLIKALKYQKPYSKVFAVGDDWQSIYRFAGSDITIFTEFEADFGSSWLGRLQQSYRCNQVITDAAAAFVQRNPAQIGKQVRSARPGIARSLRVIPLDIQWGDSTLKDACLALLQRLNAFAASIADKWQTAEKRQLQVLILSRYNRVNPWKGEPPSFSHLALRSMTFHRAKGLEADYSVLLDVSEGDYGVPSRIEDDELLNLVIPQPETFPYAEERRLFYVALTRASRGVWLLTDQKKPSIFLKELREVAGEDLHVESVEGQPVAGCKRCGQGFMVPKKRRDGGSFTACSRYPECKSSG